MSSVSPLGIDRASRLQYGLTRLSDHPPVPCQVIRVRLRSSLTRQRSVRLMLEPALDSQLSHPVYPRRLREIAATPNSSPKVRAHRHQTQIVRTTQLNQDGVGRLRGVAQPVSPNVVPCPDVMCPHLLSSPLAPFVQGIPTQSLCQSLSGAADRL